MHTHPDLLDAPQAGGTQPLEFGPHCGPCELLSGSGRQGPRSVRDAMLLAPWELLDAARH